MSRHEHDAWLADDIFGGNTLMPETGYNEAASVMTAPVQNPEAVRQPEFMGYLPQNPNMAVFRELDGQVVLRDYTPRPAPTSPVNELTVPIVSAPRASTMSPVSSLSFNLVQSQEGLSGDFDVQGDIMKLLGGLTGAGRVPSAQPAAIRQLESRITPTNFAEQCAVNPTPPIQNETEADYEYNPDSLSNAAKTVATRGLKKVVKSVFRPRLASAVLVLSAATAGGAYYLGSGGESPVRSNPAKVLQADISQWRDHPIETLIAQSGRF